MTELKVYSDSWDVDTRLAELGLKQDKLIHAVQLGLPVRRTTLRHHRDYGHGLKRFVGFAMSLFRWGGAGQTRPTSR